MTTPACRVTRRAPCASSSEVARGRRAVASGEAGSVLLLVLLVALASAVLVAGLAVAFAAGSAGLAAEESGREGLARADTALVALAAAALERWEARPLDAGEEPVGELKAVPETGGLLGAEVPPWPGGSASGTAGVAGAAPFMYRVAAHVELGHDGLDLPCAAVVAEGVQMASARGLVGIISDGGEEGSFAVATCRPVVAGVVARGGAEVSLPGRWLLDGGTFTTAATEAERPGSRITVFAGRPGERVAAPAGNPGPAPENCGVVVVDGGARLDCRERGDVYGVLVVGEGGVELDGTRLHGAIYCTGVVDLGQSGQVVWSRSVYRWATDRSVSRVRLVPGSRVEEVVP